jgi:tetratricopeptide (TPR) repeat protein
MAQDLYSILDQARAEDSVGNHSKALMLYRMFLKHDTADPSAWADYAGVLIELERFDDSVKACDQALAADPDCEPALINKGAALMYLQQYEEAKTIYGQLRAKNPGRADLVLYHQKCNYKLGDLTTIEPELEPLLEIDPDNLDILTFLMRYSITINDHQKYKLYSTRILDIRAETRDDLKEKGMLLVRVGEMKEGFKFLEHRKMERPDTAFTEPIWNGEPFPNRTLLLHWEQGFGDTIMMLRFLPQVKALGGTVILQVQAPLVELAKTCTGYDQVITNQDPLSKFDIQLRLMSLPFVLGTDIDSVPAQLPYLSVPPTVKNREAIIDRLSRSEKPKKIGLVWAGGLLFKKDHVRSISPELLFGFEQYQDAAWFSLQRETPDMLPFQGLAPLADLLETFADTAFAINCMDLIVTVDTAAAHLTGALGKPGLLMLPFLSDWRWMLGRRNSPWYPTLRLYRQPSEGAWGEVINEVVRDLRGN